MQILLQVYIKNLSPKLLIQSNIIYFRKVQLTFRTPPQNGTLKPQRELKFFLSASNYAPCEAIKTLKLCKLSPYIRYLKIASSSKLSNRDPGKTSFVSFNFIVRVTIKIINYQVLNTNGKRETSETNKCIFLYTESIWNKETSQ